MSVPVPLNVNVAQKRQSDIHDADPENTLQ